MSYNKGVSIFLSPVRYCAKYQEYGTWRCF